MPITDGRDGYARIAVLTATEDETRAVHRACEIGHRIKKGYFTKAGSDPVFPDVIHTQVGRNNMVAGLRTEKVIERWQPEFIVFCGTAGGINGRKGIGLGDIVVPEYVHYCSFAKLSENGFQVRYAPYDHPSIPLHQDHVLHFSLEWPKENHNQIHAMVAASKILTNSLVAGDKIFGDPTSAEQRRIIEIFDDAVAIDMESVGVCRAVASCRSNPSYNPRLLIVRCISDMVDSGGNNAEREEWTEPACAIGSAFVQRLINEMLLEEPDPRPARTRNDDQ